HPPAPSPLSLHDALPISQHLVEPAVTTRHRDAQVVVERARDERGAVEDVRLDIAMERPGGELVRLNRDDAAQGAASSRLRRTSRSEEHTSELQSLTNLVC